MCIRDRSTAASSQPSTATSRPSTAASSRPGTGSRPATAKTGVSSRCITTASSRPPTAASSRPTTGMTRPVSSRASTVLSSRSNSGGVAPWRIPPQQQGRFAPKVVQNSSLMMTERTEGGQGSYDIWQNNGCQENGTPGRSVASPDPSWMDMVQQVDDYEPSCYEYA
eukprot:TRINITY_DN12641_c0_g1_i3.p1 TRINITY_DN12641_c0_g1~~TRINITY_DN12641_c0_g1_i3.p1  ORF type:complete len:167 (-),score=13.09 TRINITY_DN12641_c0_g1_i3:86-586(-)